jgi:feruloyl esterase
MSLETAGVFLVPGVHHGGGGPGFTEFDSLTALENWVENGQAPEKLITGRLSNGVVERTRPVFPYPVLARYSGKTALCPLTPPNTKRRLRHR